MNLRSCSRWLAVGGALLISTGCHMTPSARAPEPRAAGVIHYVADGRAPLADLADRYRTLQTDHGWHSDAVYTYPDDARLEIRAWRTAQTGPALWILAGVHGEEPAGPNAIADTLASLVDLAATGVPIVVIPLCNPKAYRNNWRYPNSAERDWRKGGYSVGDAEYLLPDPDAGATARAAGPPGPETRALTEFVLKTSAAYPPQLVLDLHEDELSTSGGYIYSQGRHADGNPVGAEIVRLLQAAGIPLRTSGTTRFGEPIVAGVISRDERGLPIRDGSIDELLSAPTIFKDGRRVAGPAAKTAIVVETPAFSGSKLELRVAAQSAVLKSLRELWRLNSALP